MNSTYSRFCPSFPTKYDRSSDTNIIYKSLNTILFMYTNRTRARVKFTLRFAFTKTSKTTRFSSRIYPAVCDEISRYWIMPEYRKIIIQTPKSYPTDGNSLRNVFFSFESYRQFNQNVQTPSPEYVKVSRNYLSETYCTITCYLAELNVYDIANGCFEVRVRLTNSMTTI